MQNIPKHTFVKLRPNMMNLTFTVCFFRDKFVKNNTFSITNAVNIVFTCDLCILTFYASMNILYHSNILVFDKHSSPYILFNISNVLVAVFFNFTQN
jgi:hypothetical protein